MLFLPQKLEMKSKRKTKGNRCFYYCQILGNETEDESSI